MQPAVFYHKINAVRKKLILVLINTTHVIKLFRNLKKPLVNVDL